MWAALSSTRAERMHEIGQRILNDPKLLASFQNVDETPRRDDERTPLLKERSLFNARGSLTWNKGRSVHCPLTGWRARATVTPINLSNLGTSTYALHCGRELIWLSYSRNPDTAKSQ